MNWNLDIDWLYMNWNLDISWLYINWNLVVVKLAIIRLCGLWPGDSPGDTPWKDVEGALLAEVKSSAYGDLDRRPTRRLS